MVDVLRVRTPLITATRLPPGEHRDAGLRRGTQPSLHPEPPSSPAQHLPLNGGRYVHPACRGYYARLAAERAAFEPLPHDYSNA